MLVSPETEDFPRLIILGYSAYTNSRIVQTLARLTREAHQVYLVGDCSSITDYRCSQTSVGAADVDPTAGVGGGGATRST